MLAFEIAAAMLAVATAPQHATPSRPAANAHQTTAHKTAAHGAECRKAYRNYDARTDTYRDARGKRQRCTR